MKYLIVILFACFSVYFMACQKEEAGNNPDSFIRSVSTDSAVVSVATLDLKNGIYLTIGRDKKHEHPGYAFKMDKKGEILFKKRLSGLITQLQSVIDLPGNGFATVGHSNPYQKILIVCIYDDEANLISSKQIQLPDYAGNYPIFRILQLSNGNYAFASGNGVGNSTGDLIFTDNNFNNLSYVTFTAPAGFYGFAINALTEMPGNIIAIGGSTNYTDATSTLLTSYSNLFIQRISFSGTKLSFKMTGDSVHSETPNCLLNADGNIFAVTARSIGWNSGNGCFVDYEFSRFNSTISGMINLNLHDSAGNLLIRKQINGYPGNGMIQTIKPTKDQGYILCGTVNQANSSTVVSETRIYLLKIDRNLNIQWTKTIDTPNPSYGVEAMEMPDGGFLVTGYHYCLNGDFNALLIKTDEKGEF